MTHLLLFRPTKHIMRGFRFLLIFAGLVIALSGCRKESNVTILGANALTVDEKLGSVVISIQALQDWTASASDKWIKINPSSGTASEGPIEVTLSYGYNPLTEDRIGTVDITAGKSHQSVALKQKGRVVPPGGINMGVSVIWAACNLGANKPEQRGDFFAWGESESKLKTEQYPWFAYYNYKWIVPNSLYAQPKFTKYVFASTYGDFGEPDNLYTLEPEDDAAHVALGGAWRMPTEMEWYELDANCDWTLTDTGFRLVSKITQAVLFLPFSGYQTGDLVVNNQGWYWSSNITGADVRFARMFHIGETFHEMRGEYREKGLTIRPVSD